MGLEDLLDPETLRDLLEGLTPGARSSSPASSGREGFPFPKRRKKPLPNWSGASWPSWGPGRWAFLGT